MSVCADANKILHNGYEEKMHPRPRMRFPFTTLR